MKYKLSYPIFIVTILTILALGAFTMNNISFASVVAPVTDAPDPIWPENAMGSGMSYCHLL